MEFVRLLLVFLHLLGMAMLVGTFLLQLRTAPGGPLNKGWLHGGLLQLLTGVALVGVAYGLHKDVDNFKIGIKLLVLVAILGLAGLNLRKEQIASWLTPTLAGLTVLNVGVAVFWT